MIIEGSGTATSINGLGSAATFNNPYGLVIDSFGYRGLILGVLYISDYTGNVIR